jgi:H+/Cl- antiporter ClcA
MKTTTDFICLGLLMLCGVIYGIVGIVTRKTSYAGRSYEGKNAVAASWAILCMFALLAIAVFACALSGRG